MTYYFGISNLYLSCTNQRKTIISDSVQFHKASFIFDIAWEDYGKTATFTNSKSGTSKNVPLTFPYTCDIPWEVLTTDGYLIVCVNGVNGDSEMVTLMPNPILIELSNKSVGTSPTDPTPSVYDQIMTSLGELGTASIKDMTTVAISDLDDTHDNEIATVGQIKAYINSKLV